MVSLHIVEAGLGVQLYDDTYVNFTWYTERGGVVIERKEDCIYVVQYTRRMKCGLGRFVK